MPVNPSEVKFFDQLAKEAKENPPKPLSQQTMEEYRAND